MNAPLNKVDCPSCGQQVDSRAPACPNCGEKIYVEHPGDMHRVRHSPTHLPPADPNSYGPQGGDASKSQSDGKSNSD